MLGLGDRATLRHTRAAAVLATLEADMIFIDPPYTLEREYERSLSILGEIERDLVIVQHSTRLALADAYGRLRRSRVLKQGDNALSFYG